MHVGRLMARLNPKNVRFDVGSGGIPELTPQDIAAALGCVEEGIGREMLCQVWWPDGARFTEGDLLQVLMDAQRLEWMRREDEMLNAMLAVAQSGSRAQSLFASAHQNRWPSMVKMEHGVPVTNQHYASIRIAVIREIAGTGLCPLCTGHTVIQSASGPVCILRNRLENLSTKMGGGLRMDGYPLPRKSAPSKSPDAACNWGL
jgi:hypothetical protein